MMVNTEKPTLIYVGDPMCSWCYGIANELDAVRNHFEEEIDFELVMGGLRPYNTETMSDLKSFLTHHWEDVHKASGQEFNYAILDDTDITYDTEPPSRANVIIRQMHPDLAFEFFHHIQKAFYQENKNMHHADSYFEILDSLKIDKEVFTTMFNSSEMKEKVKLDFQRASELGVRSFPTILLKTSDKTIIIAKGFASKTDMITKINNAIK